MRQVLRPSYNRAGALESATIDGQTRQRILLALGNGVVTRYAYDPQNFRLRRMRAETCSKSGTTYTPLGTVFEDCGYHDDLDGNILGLIDKSSEGAAIASRFAQPSTLQGYGFGLPTDAQIRQYTYDPLGRVLSSQGFEHVNRAPSAPWDDTITAQLSDPNEVRAFNETYSYDKTSGLQSLSHTPSEGTSGYTRNYSFASGSNRLASMTVGGTTYNYVYGPTGCMTKENTERHYVWDGARRLSLFKVQVSGSAATKVGQYLYDGGGERRVKIKSTTGRHEITYYLGAFELTRLIRTGQAEASNSLAFIHDAGTAIFRGRSGDVLPGESSRPAEQYTLSDHLGSASTTVDDTGAKISREAYTAYGESTYGSFEKKRYRFTGKERDEESGLNYHSARYYAPWLGKWLTPDPSGFVDGPNLYAYVRGNPVNVADPTGNEGEPKNGADSNKAVTQFGDVVYGFGETFVGVLDMGSDAFLAGGDAMVWGAEMAFGTTKTQNKAYHELENKIRGTSDALGHILKNPAMLVEGIVESAKRDIDAGHGGRVVGRHAADIVGLGMGGRTMLQLAARKEILQGGLKSVGQILKGAGEEVRSSSSAKTIIAQELENTCVAASCRMIAIDAGIKTSETAVAKLLNTTSNGAHLADAAEALNSLGLPHAKFHTNATFAQLDESIRTGASAIVGVRVPGVGSHAMVVDGIADGWVSLRDPLVVGEGSSFAIKQGAFENVWKKTFVGFQHSK